jgi:hypothetical protein
MYFFIDVYKKSNSRISKDTAGGYGTENLLGSGFFSPLAQYLIKKGVFWPNLSFMHSLNELGCRGADVKYIRCSLTEEIKYDGDLEEGICFMCSSLVCFETEIEFAVRLKKKYPKLKICFLGQIAFELKEHIPIDFSLVGGNYEFLFANEAAFNIFVTQIKKGRVVDSGKNIFPVVLTAMDWNYFGGGFKNKLFTNKRNYPYLASRGCPYSCIEYCSYPIAQGRKILGISEDKVISDLRQIAKYDPDGHVIFRDPVFSIQPTKTFKLLNKIAESSIGLTYTAEIHLKNCNEELIEAFHRAGFTHLKFGIESSSEFVRNGSSRYSVSNDQQMRTISELKKVGIMTDGMFILGMPNDNADTVDATIRYACNIGLDFAQFSIFTPYPGTKAYNDMICQITASEFQQLNQFKLNYKHPQFESAELDRLLYKAYKRFYSKKLITLSNFLK